MLENHSCLGWKDAIFECLDTHAHLYKYIDPSLNIKKAL